MANKKKKKGFVISLILLAAIAFGGFWVYKVLTETVQLKDKKYTYFYIKRDDTYKDVLSNLRSEDIIENTNDFDWLATKMGLDKQVNIHAGRYRIINGMTMRKIINLIKYNKQEKVNLYYTPQQIRDLEEFIEYTSQKLDIRAEELDDYLKDEKKLADNFNLDPDNSFALVVPGTYQVSWAISADELFDLFKERYWNIWNESRKSRATQMGYSVAEIITLASIVQSESGIKSEQQKIAGVYLNRLRKKMPLQADPTLKFANKRYDAKRFWDSDKATSSPYNTYKYKGLPPGPICLVYPTSIDATLNYVKHKYLYFCAKPQLNGYSDFSETYEQHAKYAKAYKQTMNKRGINR